MEMSQRAVLNAAREQGWVIEQTRGGHIRMIPPDRTKKIVVLGSTESDRRAMQNTLARLRKSGFKDPGK